MDKLIISMPRGPYFILLAIGLTAMSLTFITEPNIWVKGDLSGFSLMRWGVAVGSFMMCLWGIKGIFFPSILFGCGQDGVKIPVYPDVIQWEHVRDVKVSQMSLGLSGSHHRRIREIESDSIVILFSDSIELKAGGRTNSHGRITGKHAYTFSTEVQRKAAGDVLNIILGFKS